MTGTSQSTGTRAAGARAAALARLRRTCGPICAEGTDPASVAKVLVWSVRPRRSPDALRRACRDVIREPGDPAEQLVAAVGDAYTSEDAAAAGEIAGVWRRLGVQVAVVGDLAYPGRLAEGWPETDGPPMLAWRGAACGPGASVALVGSRRATPYGTGVAAWLAEVAASAGIRVVSGGAVGVDAAAHRAAAEQPGGSTVVLGCGHGVAYPRAHARRGGLFDRIVERGGTIVSELLPHEPPRPGLIRARNRIVAALADAVVVVEGGQRSGSLLTATAAADRGRTVLAVPGDIRAPGSVAPHRLLAEGAAPCTGPQALLDVLAVPAQARGDTATADRRDDPGLLPPAVHRALRDAWPRPVPVDELAAATGTAIPALLGALTRARAAGAVVTSVEGLRLRQPPGRWQPPGQAP